MAGAVEVERLRATVSSAIVLEKAGSRLDDKESTRRSMKCRRRAGENIIVNHDGQGWWDTP